MDPQAPVKLARSAEKLSQSAADQTDSADRRTELAATRTVLAAERTYAAWMRTALASLASGIGARALLEGHVPGLLARGAGVVLVAFAAACLIAGVWRELSPGAPPPKPDVKRIPPALLIGFNGFLLLVCVAVLAGFVLD
jgi:putative membrane protein